MPRAHLSSSPYISCLSQCLSKFDCGHLCQRFIHHLELNFHLCFDMASCLETKSLESLPVELIEAVLEELPKKDLRTIRHVCKEIEAKSFEYYTKVLFVDRTFFLCSQHGIQDLHNISCHPRFSRSLRRVTLVLQSLHLTPLTERWSAFARALKSGEAALSREQMDEYISLRRIYSSLADGSNSYPHSSGCKDPLYDSLNNLLAQDSGTISLKVTACPSASLPGPKELHLLEEALGPLERFASPGNIRCTPEDDFTFCVNEAGNDLDYQ